MREALAIAKQINQAGGTAYLVGGCVRDYLLGQEPKDIDIEVFGLTPSQLLPLLGPDVKFCGESFGVYKIGNLDISIPRREVKSGQGHRGFEVECDPYMPIEEAASRRDFTINAILYNPLTQVFFDPFNGIKDLEDKRLSVTSYRFAEDPLRVLRGMQFASRFNLLASPATISLCQQLVEQMKEISKERIYGEWEKWAKKAIKPSTGLKFLEITSWLKNFPILYRMSLCANDWWNTLSACDEVVKLGGDHITLFSALLNTVGPIQAKLFFEQHFAGFCKKELDEICHLISLLRSPCFTYTLNSLAQVRDFLHRRLKGTTFDRFNLLVRAINQPLYHKTSYFLSQCSEYLKTNKLEPLVKGQDLIDRGFSPGSDLGKILSWLYDEQIDHGSDKETLLKGISYGSYDS